MNFDLQGMWDSARGVFKDYADYDNFKFNQKMAEDRYRWERDSARKDAPAQSNWGPVGTTSNGRDTKTLLIGAVVLGGAFMAAKQFKLI